jgi:hypothetical protein
VHTSAAYLLFAGAAVITIEMLAVGILVHGIALAA